MESEIGYKSYESRKTMIAAIFDLDGTLYTGHILRGIEQHHRTHQVQRLPLYAYMFSHMALWPLYQSGLMSEAAAREQWARHLGWTVRGWTPTRAQAAFRWIAEHYVRPLVRADVLARVYRHQANGHRVILVSGTPAPLLVEIGQVLGIGEVVGTPLVVRNACYTGASEPPVCQGPGKVRRLEEHLRRGNGVSWTDSFAYADSHTDLSLLEHVGHPVAVYPDVPLAAAAQERGWEIVGQVSPVAHRRF